MLCSGSIERRFKLWVEAFNLIPLPQSTVKVRKFKKLMPFKCPFPFIFLLNLPN